LVAVVDERAVTLGTLEVTAMPRTFVAPKPAYRVDRVFPGVGTLVGFDISVSGDCHLDLDDPVAPRLVVGDFTTCRPELTLVWRAEGDVPIDYKVFNHMLSTDGTMIAQHDGPPADGERHTTGWVAGEYITDSHALTFNVADYLGPVMLKIGLYDPVTMARVPTIDGDDQVSLNVAVNID
jgi:hypothetical protein